MKHPLSKILSISNALVLLGFLTTMQANAASQKTLVDFKSPTESLKWQVVNDDVMGGVSTEEVQKMCFDTVCELYSVDKTKLPAA